MPALNASITLTDAETDAFLTYGMARLENLPNSAEPVVVVNRQGRWEFTTPPKSGGNGRDYSRWVIKNRYKSMGYSDAVITNPAHRYVMGIDDWRSSRGIFCDGASIGPTTWEPVYWIKRTSDPTGPSNYLGINHSKDWLIPTGCTVIINGAGSSHLNDPLETVIRCQSAYIETTYNMLCPGDLGVIGTLKITHMFDANGLRVVTARTVTATDVEIKTGYGAMGVFTRPDMIQPGTGTPLPIAFGSNGFLAEMGQISAYHVYYSSAPEARANVILPRAAPGTTANDWSNAVDMQSKIQERTDAKKLYVADVARQTYVPFVTGSHVTDYQLEIT